jgi:hypothetical protein
MNYQTGLTQVNIDERMYHSLLSANGSLYFKDLPVPQSWSPIHRPHVALLYCENKKVFRFFLSVPSGNERISVWDAKRLEYNSLIEIKHSDQDYRYFRRDNGTWTMVGEARDHPYEELDSYHFGFVKIGNAV